MSFTVAHKSASAALIIFALAAVTPLTAQQGAATGQPLVIRTTTLPRGYLSQPYQVKLEADGGITPLRWELVEGNLPKGIMLHPEGILVGAPLEAGEFHFTVNVIDSGRPAMQRSQPLVLSVVAPLLAQWGRYPKVNGQRIEGSIIVSNQTDNDFDLTAVIMAVADNGRATAIGYQRLPLKKDTSGLEIPFGENLPYGQYQVNADVVAEISATNTIHRARLVPDEKFNVVQGP
jgi:hypothetical protein